MRSWLRALAARLSGRPTPGPADSDPSQASHIALGQQGEDLAAAHLRRAGYRILKRNAASRFGEIDIVASQGDVLCFVEVKTRRGTDVSAAVAAVTEAKQRRMERAALDFARRNGMLDAPCRFDVVAVCIPPDGTPEVALFPNAFIAKGRV